MNPKFSVIKPPWSSKIVMGIAKAYQQTFAGYPWFEGYKCPVCGDGFPLTHTEKTCAKCSTSEKRQVLLVDYWPTSTIISDFKNEMTKPGAICVIAKVDKQIIGFTWGYNVVSNPELDKHLDAHGLHKIVSGESFYPDEVAVAPDYQKKGIGKKLITKILSEQMNEQVILRTKEEGPMFNLVIKMGGEVIQHISRERVIMKMMTKK